MAKDWKGPVKGFRTPAEHRAIIQNPRANPVSKAKLLKKARRSKWKQIPGFASYADYLKSDAWKEIKSRWMKSNLCKGERCHSDGCDQSQFLNLHHITYKRIGREQLQDLILVCNKCHLKIHQLEKSGMSLHDATKLVTTQSNR